MTKRKSANQKKNTGSSDGMDQARRRTLAKEIMPKLDKVEMTDLNYPDTLKTAEGKFYFDAIKESCLNLSILVHEQDKFLMARLARYMVISDTLLAAGELQPVVTEMNGNTRSMQTKTNQNLTAALQVDRRIESLTKSLGMSPAARADIFQKMIALKSEDVFDNKTAQAMEEDNLQVGLHAVGKTNNPFRKFG